MKLRYDDSPSIHKQFYEGYFLWPPGYRLGGWGGEGQEGGGWKLTWNIRKSFLKYEEKTQTGYIQKL